MTSPGFIIPEKLPGAPDRYDAQQENAFRRILELLLRRTAEAVVNVQDAGDGVLPRRRVTRLKTPAIGLSGKMNGQFILPTIAGTFGLDMRTYAPLWWRMYANEQDMKDDKLRGIHELTPRSPTLLDILFDGDKVFVELDRAAWVAGPNCTAAESFGYAKDNDISSAWTSAEYNMNAVAPNSPIFVVDLGSTQRVQQAVLEMPEALYAANVGKNGGPAHPPQAPTGNAAINVFGSTDGSTFFFIPQTVTGEFIMTFKFMAAVQTRYLKFTLVNPLDQDPAPWLIAEVRAGSYQFNRVPDFLPLDRGLWAPLATCHNSAQFPEAVDGDGNSWSSNVNQVAGMEFSWDMKQEQRFSRLTLDAGDVGNEFPVSFNVFIAKETETGGIGTYEAHPNNPITGAKFVEVKWDKDQIARFVKITIEVPRTSPASRWFIQHVNLLDGPINSLHARIFAGDLAGAPAFNWDNPAQSRVWYNLLLLNPDEEGALWSSTQFGFNVFVTDQCTTTTWHLEQDSSGNWFVVIDSTVTSYEICEAAGNFHSPGFGGPFLYSDAGSYFPRYYRIFEELRSGVDLPDAIARLSDLPADRNVCGFAAFLRRASVDTATISAAGAAYLKSSGWESSPHLLFGLRRDSASTTIPFIQWRNAAGSNITLNEGTPISFPLLGYIFVRGSVEYDTDSATGVTCKVTVADQQGNRSVVAQAAVPQALLDLPKEDHRGAGYLAFYSAPGGEPFAFAGFAAAWLAIYGAENGATIDFGHTPIERSGGSLSSQPLILPADNVGA